MIQIIGALFLAVSIYSFITSKKSSIFNVPSKSRNSNSSILLEKCHNSAAPNKLRQTTWTVSTTLLCHRKLNVRLATIYLLSQQGYLKHLSVTHYTKVSYTKTALHWKFWFCCMHRKVEGQTERGVPQSAPSSSTSRKLRTHRSYLVTVLSRPTAHLVIVGIIALVWMLRVQE